MEKEDVEMGGTGSPSQRITIDAAMNTESTTKTYAQAAAQTQEEYVLGLPLGLKVFGPWAHHTEEVGMRY